ncbi:MAG: adenylate/guanylate cyclase domain-containing protein [Spirochaetes bacterium]|nr:adenylate/guanylate cyclase domain-containing protein [Spirochaetota bacterium]
MIQSEKNARDGLSDEDLLKAKIAETFLNRQLEEFLVEHGNIPDAPDESCVGVGFADIVDYSYMSTWLSPRENQRLLNGLYTAFLLTLKKRGGYLNKIAGDSIMFHFGGFIDPTCSGLAPEEAETLIARLLFQTCVEIQESCRLFNRADVDFIPSDIDPDARTALSQAFLIIRSLRESMALASSVSSMFQVRIRVGAALGDVCVGSFGPEGAKQWDVIGVPVIEARRMEASAPADGIRISRRLMEALERTDLVGTYHKTFRSKASGFYQTIRRDELFAYREVILSDKRQAMFPSWSVQANPDLPEDVWRQVEFCLEKGEEGIGPIINLIKYYRGNRLVSHAFEEFFREHEIAIRKAEIFRFLLPGKFRKLVEERGGDERGVLEKIESSVSLFQLLNALGKIQDSLKPLKTVIGDIERFDSWDAWMKDRIREMNALFDESRRRGERQRYFEEVLLPGFMTFIEASVREYFSKGKAIGAHHDDPIEFAAAAD